MSRRVLVLGASGFIGAHVAATLAAAGWTVRAGARRPETARRLAPAHDWVRAEFGDLTTPAAWAPLLEGVQAVVNCVGVLQDGGGDSTRLAHVDGPAALIAACEAAGVRRLVHVSAAGADDAAGTAYARTKAETERLLAASGLDWVILRPSLVLGRGAYGGTALMRGLAAFPGMIPVLGGDQRFRPVAMDDVAAAVARLIEPDAPARLTLDVSGPDQVTQAGLLVALRGWLGLPPAPVVRVPAWLAAPAILAGDLAGRLGWPSSLRSTSVRQMAHGAAGEGPAALTAATGVAPRPLERLLSDAPATVADRWHARLQFVRPLSIVVLGLFWIVTGLVTVGPGWRAAVLLLLQAGFGGLSGPVAFWGGAFDVALGLALFVRPWTRAVAVLMCLVTVGYLVSATIWAPAYWIDPLGPWLKVIPMMALCLFVAATDDRR